MLVLPGGTGSNVTHNSSNQLCSYIFKEAITDSNEDIWKSIGGVAERTPEFVGLGSGGYESENFGDLKW